MQIGMARPRYQILTVSLKNVFFVYVFMALLDTAHTIQETLAAKLNTNSIMGRPQPSSI